jgi:hypothetical protein
LLGLPTTETVTGTLIVAGPVQLAESPAMSRYDPVNGWLLPDTIVVEPIDGLVDEDGAEMSEREPVTLKFLTRQQHRMLAELASLRDDVNVLTAIVQRLDNSYSLLLAEIRATHSQA